MELECLGWSTSYVTHIFCRSNQSENGRLRKCTYNCYLSTMSTLEPSIPV